MLAETVPGLQKGEGAVERGEEEHHGKSTEGNRTRVLLVEYLGMVGEVVGEMWGISWPMMSFYGKLSRELLLKDSHVRFRPTAWRGMQSTKLIFVQGCVPCPLSSEHP
jgi:hypothetical protein